MNNTLSETEPRYEPNVLLIPGIGISYLRAVKRIKGEATFQKKCAIAGVSDFSKATAESFENHEPFLYDTLENQKLSYIVNCSMCDLYNRRGFMPQFVVGYSMGIYSALYAAGFYSFETGLAILEKAFHLIRDLCSCRSDRYGMGLVLGLTQENLRNLIFKEGGGGINIAVYNGKHNFVIAGKEEELAFSLDKAHELGALGVRRILTGHPYHTAFLKDVSEELSRFLKTFEYYEPLSQVVSLMNGSFISKRDLIDTVVRKIYSPLRFDDAVYRLAHKHKIRVCYETGPANSMEKLVRYIYRKIRVRHYT
jgi:malonyl CoA-acyl carrier protein transacylase